MNKNESVIFAPKRSYLKSNSRQNAVNGTVAKSLPQNRVIFCTFFRRAFTVTEMLFMMIEIIPFRVQRYYKYFKLYHKGYKYLCFHEIIS